jgi:hypothetical protein
MVKSKAQQAAKTQFSRLDGCKELEKALKSQQSRGSSVVEQPIRKALIPHQYR